jgi:hypothetical protein
MNDYKVIYGYFAVIIGIVSYVIYFRQIFLNKVKPHAFTWFIWGLIEGVVFAAQTAKHGGPGTWVTGLTSLACFAICFLGLVKGERKFVKLDWLFFAAAMVAIFLWWLTKNPTASVILLTLADAGGSFLTIRKSYYKPEEEGATVFALSTLKWIPALFALDSYSLTTWLYPASLILTNSSIVIMTLLRRRNLKAKSL